MTVLFQFITLIAYFVYGVIVYVCLPIIIITAIGFFAGEFLGELPGYIIFCCLIGMYIFLVTAQGASASPVVGTLPEIAKTIAMIG